MVVGGWCKVIFMSNPQPSCFGLLLGWVAVAWLGFGVMTIIFYDIHYISVKVGVRPENGMLKQYKSMCYFEGQKLK